MNHIKSRILALLLFICLPPVLGRMSNRDINWKDIDKKVFIYEFSINNEIGPATWRITKKAFDEARTLKADLVIIHLNTYGGMVDAADSIRTAILNCPVPVYIFIDNNAASAGALISIAGDRIYMREGGSIGAASVVNQSGEILPEKYQSFMRSKMRATAEAHGRDTIINGKDTTYVWFRDPTIAEAMVDPRVYIPNVIDSGKLITFTTDEAIKHGYCEGKASSMEEVIKETGIKNYEVKEFKLTSLEKIIGFLVNPIIQGILIMIIIGGIYFELQTPGIGFPIAAAITAAIVYFAPLYLEGLASHWEIIIFIIGLILLGIEIFAIPGFGVTGIAGIILIIAGLSLAMVDNLVFEWNFAKAMSLLLRSVFIVLFSFTVSLVLSIYLSKRILSSSRITGIALKAEQRSSEGYIGVDNHSSLVGSNGTALTMLRPSGKVEINDEAYDAICEIGYINAGEKVTVTRYETGQVYVQKFVSA